MRLKLKSSDISLNILGSSFLIVGLALIILLFNYNLVEGDYIANNKLNKVTFDKNQKKLSFLEQKVKINQLILDVNLASTYVLHRLDAPRGGKEIVKHKELDALWKEKIIPKLNSLNESLKDQPDELKAGYYKIFDNIYRVKKIHNDLLANYVDSTSSSLREREKIAQIAKVSQYTGELNTSSKEFLNENLQEGKGHFFKPKYKEDYFGLVVISGLVFLVGVLLIVYRSSRFLKYPIRRLETILKNINEGNLLDLVSMKTKDYLQIDTYIKEINNTFQKVQIFAQHASDGKFDLDQDMSFEGNGKLGDSLHGMQKSLLNIAKEEAQRSHVNQGLARFSEILGDNSNNLLKFGDDVILNLVQFLNANQGALFVVNEEETVPSLALVSCYAYEKKKYLNKKIVKGQGLVGQCWQEEKSVYMTDIPADYISITSGLGHSTPRCVLIIPLIFNETIQGVIEMASFKKLENYELSFVEKVAQNIASALASVKVNSKTQVLLNQSEQLTKKMMVQEEEMLLNVEELRLTQEESQRREEEHLREISRLRKRLEEYERNF